MTLIGGVRRVIEQYPGVYEDEIQGRLSSVHKRKDSQCSFHQSMLNPCTSKYTTRQLNLRIRSNHVDLRGYTVAAIFFENKSGIPITPYKERMIDGSESSNAHGSFYLRVAYQ